MTEEPERKAKKQIADREDFGLRARKLGHCYEWMGRFGALPEDKRQKLLQERQLVQEFITALRKTGADGLGVAELSTVNEIARQMEADVVPKLERIETGKPDEPGERPVIKSDFDADADILGRQSRIRSTIRALNKRFYKLSEEKQAQFADLVGELEAAISHCDRKGATPDELAKIESRVLNKTKPAIEAITGEVIDIPTAKDGDTVSLSADTADLKKRKENARLEADLEEAEAKREEAKMQREDAKIQRERSRRTWEKIALAEAGAGAGATNKIVETLPVYAPDGKPILDENGQPVMRTIERPAGATNLQDMALYKNIFGGTEQTAQSWMKVMGERGDSEKIALQMHVETLKSQQAMHIQIMEAQQASEERTRQMIEALKAGNGPDPRLEARERELAEARDKMFAMMDKNHTEQLAGLRQELAAMRSHDPFASIDTWHSRLVKLGVVKDGAATQEEKAMTEASGLAREAIAKLDGIRQDANAVGDQLLKFQISQAKAGQAPSARPDFPKLTEGQRTRLWGRLLDEHDAKDAAGA